MIVEAVSGCMALHPFFFSGYYDFFWYIWFRSMLKNVMNVYGVYL